MKQFAKKCPIEILCIQWALPARFEDDPRFRRDYEAITENEICVALSKFEDQWIKSKTGKTMHSGNFVRKDAINKK